jgi:hypothetical protein
MTSSWSTQLPDGFARIGISRGTPRGQSGYRLYRPLAPGPWFNSVTLSQFRLLYMAQLATLDPHQVLQDLADLADGRQPVLLCFERPPPDPAWCHRGLVSAWLSDTLDLQVSEYGHEKAGWGWRHPKLPADWRRQR